MFERILVGVDGRSGGRDAIRERLDSGIAAETVVCHGAPARALRSLAEDEQADLLVVGSSHRGPVARVRWRRRGRWAGAMTPWCAQCR
jgi:nucleotide-binding universal stress UspA family protein